MHTLHKHLQKKRRRGKYFLTKVYEPVLAWHKNKIKVPQVKYIQILQEYRQKNPQKNPSNPNLEINKKDYIPWSSRICKVDSTYKNQSMVYTMVLE